MSIPIVKIYKTAKPMKVIDRKVNITIVKMIFEYKNHFYDVEDVIMCHLEKEVVIFLYDYGNYSDDSTRARLINNAYGENTIQNCL